MKTCSLIIALTMTLLMNSYVSADQTSLQDLQNKNARIHLDNHGFITSIQSRSTGKEYSPPGHNSPLLSLHENGRPNDVLLRPQSASFDTAKGEVKLTYSNGSSATVKLAQKEAYFRFQLIALEPRGKVDNVVWGPINTTICGKMGDLTGVVRDPDFAIGMMGLDDNTIPGPVEDGDCYGMGYFIHSTDPEKYPVPPQYKEGQWFNIGGNGISDTAFYSHPEEYFNQVMGSGARIMPEFGSSIVYHSRDRRRSYVHYFSLLPGFKIHERKHMVSDPVSGVDFIGSGVALYACPDKLGLKTIEKVILGEGLPYITIRGKWIRDPAALRPTLYWNGPVDKAIEYAKAMGFKDMSRDTGEFYAAPQKPWVGHVEKNGHSMTYKEFAEQCHENGLTHGGLHTLCLFLQEGVSCDVTPEPSEHLQTVCRTKLAEDISATDTEIVVTDPSFLSENTTWPKNGGGENYIRVGGEMMMCESISVSAPWILKGVKRGHASKASAHKAGDELVKLMQNCYNGFVPDMSLMLDYADYYARLMVSNGMDTINFDGFESTLYQNHGYYAVRAFCRRLFETYHNLTGGKWPRMTGSCVFAGSWEYYTSCDVGGGNHMFNPNTGSWGIEGKDIRNAWSACWFPPTFGIQEWQSDWSLYDAETLMSMAVAWDGTFALSTSQDAIDRTGDKDDILKSFAAWQEAREQQIFTEAQKRLMKDPAGKFHIEKKSDGSFAIYSVNVLHARVQITNEPVDVAVDNPNPSVPLEFALRLYTPVERLDLKTKESTTQAGDIKGVTITLPGGTMLKSSRVMKNREFIIFKGNSAYVADEFRKKIEDLMVGKSVSLSKGENRFTICASDASAPAQSRFELTVWSMGVPRHVAR